MTAAVRESSPFLFAHIVSSWIAERLARKALWAGRLAAAPSSMRAVGTALAFPLTLSLASPVRPAGAQTSASAPPTVITCTSLANLRAVLRGVNEDAAAAIPIVNDPKSDLGCTVLDRGTVTGIADHVALNGRAYDCLALQGTSVCHWVVAGSVKPPAAATGKAPAAEPGRR